MRRCTCPRSGAWLCTTCWTLLVQAGQPPPDVSEAALQRRVREVCKQLGLLHYHTRDSRKSEAGWVDSAIIHPAGGVLHLWELKREGQRPSLPQQAFLRALAAATGVDARVVTPDTLAEAVAALER